MLLMYLFMLLYMLSLVIRPLVHYYLLLRSLALHLSILMYSLNYMFHFIDYHLPSHIHYMFLVLPMSSYMCDLSLMLSHSYNSLMYTIGNSMLLPHPFMSLYMLSLYSLSSVRYYLYLHYLALDSSILMCLLHIRLFRYFNLLPSNLLRMILAHLASSSMSYSFHLIHYSPSSILFQHNLFTRIMCMLTFHFMYRFH